MKFLEAHCYLAIYLLLQLKVQLDEDFWPAINTVIVSITDGMKQSAQTVAYLTGAEVATAKKRLLHENVGKINHIRNRHGYGDGLSLNDIIEIHSYLTTLFSPSSEFHNRTGLKLFSTVDIHLIFCFQSSFPRLLIILSRTPPGPHFLLCVIAVVNCTHRRSLLSPLMTTHNRNQSTLNRAMPN